MTQLTDLQIKAFSKNTWEEYYIFCRENGMKNFEIEGEPVYNYYHLKVLSGNYEGLKLILTKILSH